MLVGNYNGTSLNNLWDEGHLIQEDFSRGRSFEKSESKFKFQFQFL